MKALYSASGHGDSSSIYSIILFQLERRLQSSLHLQHICRAGILLYVRVPFELAHRILVVFLLINLGQTWQVTSCLEMHWQVGLIKPYILLRCTDTTPGCESRVPRYLFRAFGPCSGKAGMPESQARQFAQLNTDKGVTPHAFVLGHGHKSVFDIEGILDMLNSHTWTWKILHTEFSSWSPSLILVLMYAAYIKRKDGNARVCVLDTSQAHNDIYYVQDLFRAAGKPAVDLKHLPHEILVHGRVCGDCYTAVPFDELALDVFKVYPAMRTSFMRENLKDLDKWGDSLRTIYWRDTGKPHYENIAKAVGACKIVAEKLAGGLKIAELDQIVLQLAVAFLCLRRRWSDSTIQRGLRASTVQKIIKGLDGLAIRWELLEDSKIMENVLLENGTPEVKQMTQMLRSLASHKSTFAEDNEDTDVEMADDVTLVEDEQTSYGTTKKRKLSSEADSNLPWVRLAEQDDRVALKRRRKG